MVLFTYNISYCSRQSSNEFQSTMRKNYYDLKEKSHENDHEEQLTDLHITQKFTY